MIIGFLLYLREQPLSKQLNEFTLNTLMAFLIAIANDSMAALLSNKLSRLKVIHLH